MIRFVESPLFRMYPDFKESAAIAPILTITDE